MNPEVTFMGLLTILFLCYLPVYAIACAALRSK